MAIPKRIHIMIHCALSLVGIFNDLIFLAWGAVRIHQFFHPKSLLVVHARRICNSARELECPVTFAGKNAR